MLDQKTYGHSRKKAANKSDDSGQNWKLINHDLTGLQILDIDPKTPTKLYAGTKNNGVLKSTDGGGTWKKINQGLDNLSIQAFLIDPATPTTLYIATLNGVYKSIDGGDTWARFNTLVPNKSTTIDTLFMDASTTNMLYAGTFFQGIYIIKQEK